jgi:hypothetical protein
MNNHFSKKISVFHGRKAPLNSLLVGYGALIDGLEFAMPIPTRLALISESSTKLQSQEWLVLEQRYLFDDTLYKHLVFALKYEGVNLLFFKNLFERIPKQKLLDLLQIEPMGQYTRRIWFLYEWLMQAELPLPNLKTGNYVLLLNDKLQFGINNGIRSNRHRIINDLPGTVDFCPLIFKSKKLVDFLDQKLGVQKDNLHHSVHKDILQRASSFLLLKDSKASFTIEGENPGNNRAIRWGKAIGQAGKQELSKEELLRLQQIVIENTRFTTMGFRKEGGFIGEHDRVTGEPIPDHISAKADDIDKLINGLLATNNKMSSNYDDVLAAATIAFGFVFIHPFVDGNGRLHRYIIHHILAEKSQLQGIIFPISSSILDHIIDYQKVLESFSHPLLDFIEWKETEDHNVEVVNDSIDFYRYYDATKQAEFLYDCVEDTVQRVIPEEVSYLQKYDEFKKFIDNKFEIPDKGIASLVRFLDQNNGLLSRRVRSKEFKLLEEVEVETIEAAYQEIFMI